MSTWKARRLGFESLETRRYLAAAPWQTAAPPTESVGLFDAGDDNPLNAQGDLNDPAYVQTLAPSQYYLLSNTQVRLLSETQIRGLTVHMMVESVWPGRSYLSSSPLVTGFSPQQIAWLNVANSNIPFVFLDPAQINYLTSMQVTTLSKTDFFRLPAQLVPHLTQTQIATVTDPEFSQSWPLTSRTGLAQHQIPWLSMGDRKIFWLTPQQRLWLSPTQIAAVEIPELQLVPASLVPQIPTSRLAQIHDRDVLGNWKAANPTGFAALTPSQIQSLDVSSGQLSYLSPEQRALLSAAQIAQVAISELQLIPASLVPLIPTSRLSQIHDRLVLGDWKFANAAGLAALTAVQIQSLDLTDYQFIFLTPTQRGWISDAQLAMLKFSEWRNDANGVFLTPEQISRVPLSVFASFEYPAVSLRAITPLQQSGLTRAQLLNAGHGTSGDFDLDGAIDGADLAIWKGYFRTAAGATNAQGDADGNGVVNGNDFLQWQRRLGKTPAADIWANFVPVETTQKAPVGTYTPTVDVPLGPDGLALTHHAAMERDALFALVPAGFQTHTAVASGDWTNPAIWASGAVPGAGAKVLIPAGTIVRYNANSTAALRVMRVDGTLTFAHDANTLLVIDTLIVHTNGKLHIGTPTQPIGNQFEARIQFPVDSDIDAGWDPTLVSRGLLSRGQVRMFGRTVTPYVELLVQPAAGASLLQLAQVPVNWTAGDKIVIAGTLTNNPTFGAEERRISSIVGNLITLDQPLQFAHQAPAGFGLQVHVANVERNIEISALTPDPNVISPSRLPHMFFLHNPDVQIENIHVNGLGRTDKTRRIVEPAEVVPGGPAVNPRGRYALHFHHTSVNPNLPPRIVRGSTVENGPGWGFVNHQSNVIMEDNFAHNLAGAGFVTEDGNEIGAFRRNLSIGNMGLTNVPGATNADNDVRARADIHDFGHTGNGFWLQGPGVELTDNIANATAGPAFAIFTASSKVLFDAVNLTNPALAGGQKAIPIESAPLKGFARNTSYAVQGSWDLWFTNPGLPGAPFVIDGFTSWSQRLAGVVLHYSNDVLLKNVLLVGDLTYPVRAVGENPVYGIQMNSGTENVTIDNSRVLGFDVGISTTYRSRTTIRSTTVAAVTSINIPETLISKARVIDIAADVILTPLTPTQLKGRIQSFYALNGTFQNSYQGTVDYNHLTHGAVTTPSDIQVNLPGVGRVKLYFTQQQASYVPFSTQRSAIETAAVLADPMIKPEYRNKTNAQLWSQYGFAYGMEIAPSGVLPLTSIAGGLYIPL